MFAYWNKTRHLQRQSIILALKTFITASWRLSVTAQTENNTVLCSMCSTYAAPWWSTWNYKSATIIIIICIAFTVCSVHNCSQHCTCYLRRSVPLNAVLHCALVDVFGLFTLQAMTTDRTRITSWLPTHGLYSSHAHRTQLHGSTRL